LGVEILWITCEAGFLAEVGNALAQGSPVASLIEIKIGIRKRVYHAPLRVER
jgi:hypothetical protein